MLDKNLYGWLGSGGYSLISTAGDDVATWSTFTPTVTLTGGTGNATPVYTTNTGRYATVGKLVIVDVYLTGDGGTEGAGTGLINIALPLTAGASQPTGPFPVGAGRDGSFPGAANFLLFGQIAASATVITLYILNPITTTVNFTGADQATTSRTIRLKFAYEID